MHMRYQLLFLVPMLFLCLSCGGNNTTASISGYTPIAGPQGPQGKPGTGVSKIQFCPGYTTTYPTTFPEYGTCIEGQLYAVYWDTHNAWEALIVPGYYKSTSTSAPCNFTVFDNCTVVAQ